MARSELTILYKCLSDQATLSGGNWAPALPLSNLQVPKKYHKVARSISANPADTVIRIEFDAITALRGIVVGPGNFTTAAKATIVKFNDEGFEEEAFEVQALGSLVAWGSLPFGVPDWYTGLAPWPNPERKASIIHVFEQPVGGQYFEIRIDDSANPDGYVEAGRLFMSGAWMPPHNYATESNGFGYRDNSIKSQSLSGSTLVRRRLNPRFFNFTVDYLNHSETFGAPRELMELAGYDDEVFVIPQPDDYQYLQQRSFFARIEQQNPISQAAAGYGSVGLEVTEII